MRRALCAFAVAGCATAQPAADEVKSLPDFGAPPSKHFSGYIEGNNGTQLHYYMATAEDVDWNSAPVIYWTNGGPGCSSMEGWGYEHGPFQFRTLGESKESYTHFNGNMKRNPYSWNKKANVVYVEQPPGVGFSYRPDGQSYAIDDYQNAANNYAAIKALFKKFPNLVENDFYLTGESYAGHYIPMMAQQILDGDDKRLRAQLKGMLVGNGVTTPEEPDMIEQSQIQTFFQGLQSFNEQWTAPFEVGNSLNPYNMIGHCYNPSDRAAQEKADMELDGIPSYRRLMVDAQLRKKTGKPSLATQRRVKAALSDRPAPMTYLICDDDVNLAAYLNRADVQQAINVKPNTYATCYYVPYTTNGVNVVYVYNNMAAAGKRVLIYSGAADGAVPWTTQAQWIPNDTNWTVTRNMTTWSFNDDSYPYGPQMGGSAMQFIGKSSSDKTDGIWFTTMRGCGHMVPQDCPAAAAEMLDRVVSGRFWDEPQWQMPAYKLKNPADCKSNRAAL